MSTTFDYQEYLASREWALLKNQVRDRSGGTCERCGKAPHQSTHHKTYARIGHELIEDLLGVCNPCHEWLSGKTDVDPVVAKPERQPLSPTPIPLFGWNSDESQFKCAVCSLEYVHLIHTRRVCSGDNYASGWVRGAVTRLHFGCENSHHFSLDLGFHKGYTLCRVCPDWDEIDWLLDDTAEIECAECKASA